MRNTKRRVTRNRWGWIVLGSLGAMACGGGPDWQNQYTRESSYPGNGGSLDASSPLIESGLTDDPCSDDGSPCTAPPPSSSSTPMPVVNNPQNNPDPVPWHPIIIRRK